MTEKVETLDLQARNGEVYTAVKEIINEATGDAVMNNDIVSGAITNLSAGNNELEGAINREQAKSEQSELDLQRDVALQAFYSFIYGSTFNPDPAIKAAANTVQQKLNDFPISLIRENYSDQTSLESALFNDLGQEAIVLALAAIPGAATLLDEAKAAQLAFETAYQAYDNQKLELNQGPNATQLKYSTGRILNWQLVPVLRSGLLVDPATYGHLAEFIQTVNHRINTTVKERAAQAEEETTTEDPQPDPTVN